jgi:hypothetical protein
VLSKSADNVFLQEIQNSIDKNKLLIKIEDIRSLHRTCTLGITIAM